MTNITRDVQKQDPGSGLVRLFEIKLDDSNTIYFYSGLDASLAPVVFDSNTYVALPLEISDIEMQSDGSISRPMLTIANIASVFQDSLLTDMDYEDLLGKRVTIRTTLSAYLGTTVEFPSSTYIIDRIKSKNIVSVVFELAAPYDLQGLTVPRRAVIGGACSWKYKGYSLDGYGGCSWTTDFHSATDIFVNRIDQYIVNTTFTTWAGTGTQDNYYKTTGNKVRIASDGSTSTVSIDLYWQCISNGGTTTAPSTTSSDWRQVQKYSTYSASSAYYAYTENIFNDYVLYSGELWQVKSVTQDASSHITTPAYGKYWKKADSCSKKLTGCIKRFQAAPDSNGGALASEDNKNTSLPFGGFPGAKKFG